jgi:hypothetical protein
MKVWQIYPLFKGLNHIQGLDIELGFTYISGWRGTRYQTFKPFPLTHYADISDLDSSPILGIVRDKSRVFKGSQAILGGKSRNDCSKSHRA